MRQPSTAGHLQNNGGLRGHSVGEGFPFVVFAQGPFDKLRWKVKHPDGSVSGDFRSATTAGLYARYLKQERDK